jgi:ubiquinone/menaquinone biosynthesis C-methylase UbiE
MVDEFFEACTSPENKIIIKRLKDVRGKKILELGCGAGEASVYFAKKGAEVVATDISSGMLEVVKKVADKHGVIVATKQCYSHTLPFDDESFDIIYAANLLHHIELEPTLMEVKRVLKKGGVFASWDPLHHNPIINIYRRIAKDVRTEDEHPIRMSQLKIFKRLFSSVEIDSTWFFTLWIFIKFYFIDKVNPNKERYWKKILTDHRRLEKTYYRLEKLDNILVKVLPFMRRYFWNIIILCRK